MEQAPRNVEPINSGEEGHFVQHSNKLTTLLTKFLDNINSPILKDLDLCKFQVDPTINAGVTDVQGLENLYPFGSHVDWQKNTHWPIFPYNMTENPPASLGHNSAFDGFKFGTETYMIFQVMAKFGGLVDHNLRNNIFDDVT